MPGPWRPAGRPAWSAARRRAGAARYRPAGPGTAPRTPGTAGSSRPGRRPAPCSGAVPRAAARPACSGHPDPVATAKIRLAVFRWPRPALRASWAPARACSLRSSGSRRRQPGPGRGRRFTSSVLSAVMQGLSLRIPSASAGRSPVASGLRHVRPGRWSIDHARAPSHRSAAHGPGLCVTFGPGRKRAAPPRLSRPRQTLGGDVP